MEETKPVMNLVDPTMIKTEVEEETTEHDTGENLKVVTAVKVEPGTVFMPGCTIKTEVNEQKAATIDGTREAGIAAKRQASLPEYSSVDAPDVTLFMEVEEVELAEESADVHQCTVCDESFPDRLSLSEHGHSIHDDNKPFPCRLFDKLLECSSLTGPAEKEPFECGFQFCKKRFSQSYELNCHQRIHTGEKPFQCEVCYQTFRQSGDLSKHRHIHTVEKPHKCSTCGNTFRTSCNLRRHSRTHTSEKLFECEICNKKFTRSRTLTEHRRIHTGEKPFQCEICHDTFARSQSLIRHHRVHRVRVKRRNHSDARLVAKRSSILPT